MRGISPSAVALRCDVSDEDAVADSLATLPERFGRLDACFANAGVSSGNNKPFFEHGGEDWQRAIDVNLTGTFFTLRADSKRMVAQGDGGSLILTSSGAAIQGSTKGQAYASTNGALIAIRWGLATELARYNINANAVLPRIPFRRWGAPDDFAAIAVYLMSDAARRYTGDVIKIDGGFSTFWHTRAPHARAQRERGEDSRPRPSPIGKLGMR